MYHAGKNWHFQLKCPNPPRQGSNFPTPGTDDKQILMGCLRGGDVEASNWLAELPKSSYLAASDMSLLWVPIDSFQLLPFFQKPELVVNDYDLRQLWKEWFIVGGWTVVIKKLHWSLSHQCRNDM